MKRHQMLMVVVWLVAAVATAAVGTAALDLAGSGILGPGNQPLSQQDVARQLASATTSPSTSPGPSSGSASTGPSAGPSTTPTPRGLATPGGTIVAQCDRDQVFLQSWSPAQGYRTDDVHRGPASVASIKFKKGKSEVVVTVTCPAGEPRADSTPDDS
jgi:serine/threonine-protein kinase